MFWSLVPLSGQREVEIEQASHIFFAQRFITLEPSYNETASFKVNPYNSLLRIAYINPSYFLLSSMPPSHPHHTPHTPRSLFLLLAKANVNKRCPFPMEPFIFSRRISTLLSGTERFRSLFWKCVCPWVKMQICRSALYEAENTFIVSGLKILLD